MNRTLVIGDIHGGLKALQQIWERAEVDVDDKIIFLGDYVDGWADSFETIEYLIELDKIYDCIFLLGNHDLWCRDWLVGGVVPVLGGRNFTWRDVGGESTLKSYMERPPSDIESHRIFLNRLHHYYEDLHNNRVFVHGGFTQEGGVRMENPTRNLWWDRGLFEKALTHHQKYPGGGLLYDEYYPKILKTYKEIYVGHTSTQLYNTIHPMQVCNVINMDTGGGHRHGKLSIMDVDTKEYWQSDKLKDLYPDDPQNEFFKNDGKDLI